MAGFNTRTKKRIRRHIKSHNQTQRETTTQRSHQVSPTDTGRDYDAETIAGSERKETQKQKRQDAEKILQTESGKEQAASARGEPFPPHTRRKGSDLERTLHQKFHKGSTLNTQEQTQTSSCEQQRASNTDTSHHWHSLIQHLHQSSQLLSELRRHTYVLRGLRPCPSSSYLCWGGWSSLEERSEKHHMYESKDIT